VLLAAPQETEPSHWLEALVVLHTPFKGDAGQTAPCPAILSVQDAAQVHVSMQQDKLLLA
jgi:hypothetical protein